MNATSSAATPSSAPPRQASRWQDVRARAIDATFDADRRRVGERVALVFRWLFLIVLGTLNRSRVVSSIAETIGRRTGVMLSSLDGIRAAGYLHDVGHMPLPGGEGFRGEGPLRGG